MDLYSKHSINIVPVVAVDYSLANLTFDEGQYTIHTLKENAPNDYIDCMKSVAKTFRHFNRFMMAYGFGARTIMDDSVPPTNVFSMTGDFLSPFVVEEKDLVESYKETLKNVKLSLPVVYKDLVKHVCDVAAKEMGEEKVQRNITEVKNYYVLVLMMAGMVDDFKETLEQMFRAKNLPISILVIKIGKNSEENDQ